MPTIDQLPSAIASSDLDELVTTQSGSSRKVTRAQLLAGLQPSISVPPGSLLGNSGSASSGPLPITVGNNLSMSNGVISAPAPFVITSLPSASAPSAGDLIPLSQNGIPSAVTYGAFLSGLSSLTGFNASPLMVTPSGAQAARSLASITSDALTIEDFGAVGDGTTDDSAAFMAAAAAGRPVLLGPKTYIVGGSISITASAAITFIGVPGQTIIRRLAQVAGAGWIEFSAPALHVEGVTFDGNTQLTAGGEGIIIPATCLRSTFHNCTFSNIISASGLYYFTSDPALTRHTVSGCEFYGNGDGIDCEAADGLTVTNCSIHDNTGTGIHVDYTNSGGAIKSRLAIITSNHCWNNYIGIVVGDYTSADASPALISNQTADGMLSVISSNLCHDNAEYGIVAQGYNLLVSGNIVHNNGGTNPNNGGILANCWASIITGNMVSNHLGFGIDAGAANFTLLSNNFISTARIGLNAGGAQEPRLFGNAISNCSYYAIVIYNTETDGQGNIIGVASQDCSICENTIDIPSGGGGILLTDGPQTVHVARNNFITTPNADLSMCFLPLTNSVTVTGNLLNGLSQIPLYNPAVNSAGQFNGLYSILFPDFADSVSITQASQPIQSICSHNASNYAPYVTFLTVTSGGSGYTSPPTVTFSGGGGTGATANAYICNGAVIGYRMQSLGTGYTSAPTVTITGGGGSGASALAFIGIPLSQGRKLSIFSSTQCSWATTGSDPIQITPTSLPMTTMANSAVEWLSLAGNWNAVGFHQIDYLAPASDGSVSLQSITGDIRLQPGRGGAVRWTSPSDSTGCTTTVGTGSPNGVVAAPPGSDFRNLGGTAGSVFWIKQTGTDANGWIAVA